MNDSKVDHCAPPYTRVSHCWHANRLCGVLCGENIKYCDCHCQSGGDKTSDSAVSPLIPPSIGMVDVNSGDRRAGPRDTSGMFLEKVNNQRYDPSETSHSGDDRIGLLLVTFSDLQGYIYCKPF